MEERSEEQVISRLFDLENSGQAAQRAELTGERFLSLIQDPDNGLGYVFQHGLDETEGVEVPEGTEFWEYPTWDEAQRAFTQLLEEDRQAGELVEVDSGVVSFIGDDNMEYKATGTVLVEQLP